MNIYYQYSHLKTLSLTKGDFINEINMLKAIDRFANVYYSGTLFKSKCENYGLVKYKKTIVKRMLNRKYDIYFIRANKKCLFSCPVGSNSLWVASPYDKRCFDTASCIVTYSEPWAKMLLSGQYNKDFNPKGKKYKNVICLEQSIDDIFKPQQHSDKAKRIKQEVGGGPILGYFGRTVNHVFPYDLFKILPELIKIYPNIKILIGTKDAISKKFINHPNVVVRKFSYQEMPYALSACDLVCVLATSCAFDFAGSRKSLEPAACGVPVILPYSNARKKIYPKEYPLIINSSKKNGKKILDIKDLKYKIINFLSKKECGSYISKELIERSRYYSIEERSKKFKYLLEDIINDNRK
ncbi:MAG: hypothetical protein ACOC56_02745 [Atribacterota bacterium]